MSHETLEAVVLWQRKSGNGRPLEITFHGGEPLLPGAAFYRTALPLLRDALAPRRVRFAVQSNLWLLSTELCDLFRKYEVSLSTSLDGPQEINDAQRGAGYYRRTMAGIEYARAQGLSIGCICTFTRRSARRADEVFTFFLEQGLGFSVHAALPSLAGADQGWVLPPEETGSLLVNLLDQYLLHLDHIRISTLDVMSRSISVRQGGICTFGDCLGKYLAVDPGGWVYPCQRFAGMARFRLGNVRTQPSWEELKETPVWQMLEQRQERMNQECEDCAHLDICRGGCPYNVLAANNGHLDGGLRDPYCPAYQQVFDTITERALAEVFSEENLSAVVTKRPGKNGLLRKGKLLQIMRGGPHPQEVVRQARQTVAAVALGVSPTPEAALGMLARAGIITDPTIALGSLRSLRERLDAQSHQGLVNAYVHVTDACNLACRHCYAVAQPDGAAASMEREDVMKLVRQASRAGFAKAVITGGEPLMHPHRDALLDGLAHLRAKVKPMQITLRTNLAYPLTRQCMRRVLSAADEIVVSVDGDQSSHDAQRGRGSYRLTVQNLRAISEYQERIAGFDPQPAAKIRLAATLMKAQIDGAAGVAVRALGEELGLPVQFRPVLPLGRGANLNPQPSFHSSLTDDLEELAYGSGPITTCGLGMNLYIGADGTCYPCYALMQPRHYLGNALKTGLAQVLARNDTYRAVTVDSNLKCRDCALRYLCGGYCRAWGENDDHPDAPLPNCSLLYLRAGRKLYAALEALGISETYWEALCANNNGTTLLGNLW